MGLFSILGKAESWQPAGGRTVFEFAQEQLTSLGISIHPKSLSPVEFAVTGASDLCVVAYGNAFEGWAEGALMHASGLEIRTPSGHHIASNVVITSSGNPLELMVMADDGMRLFEVRNLHTSFRADQRKFYAIHGDLFLSDVLAAETGSPQHYGLFAGNVSMELDLQLVGSFASSEESRNLSGCIADLGPPVDLELTSIPNLSQVAREANVRVALAPSANLRNIGQLDIRWYWAIAPHGFNGTNIGPHPYLVMHYYRELNGVLEQIGRSDVKHAWNTVNGGCPCPGGQVMFVNCNDSYGVGNNSNQEFFGPREELTASLGKWTSLGSHFDGNDADDIRSHAGGDHDAFEHLLVVPESELATPGASYFIEVWYIVEGDTNIFNSIGYRKVTNSLLGGVWESSFTDSDTSLGPALDGWVDPDQTPLGSMNYRLDTAEGHLNIAVKTWTNVPGFYHYEYALMNLDFDRQINSLSIPISDGVIVTGLGFGDVDDELSNDWQGSIADGFVTWAVPLGGTASNACDWGTLFNFRFDANAPPATNIICMSIHEVGTGNLLLGETLAPDPNPRIAIPLIDVAARTQGVSSLWTSLSGAVYRLQSTDRLDGLSGWTNVGGPISSDGPLIEFIGPILNSQQYHRVTVEALPFP